MGAVDSKPNGHRLSALFATLGLACTFGGIWLGDKIVLGTIDMEYDTLIMRLMTLVIYLIFLAIAIWFARKPERDLRRLFGITCIFGMVCYIAGFALFFAILDKGGAVTDSPQIWIALCLTKILGPSFTIGLVCVFALQRRSTVINLSTAGMLGAFILYAILMNLLTAGIIDMSLLAVLVTILLALACFMGWVGLHFGLKDPEGDGIPHPVMSSLPGVVQRPFDKVVSPGFLIMVVFSAMMLGFLRNGLEVSDPHMQPVAVVTLVIVIIIALIWKGLRIEHMFYTAMLFSAAGILLLPVFGAYLPNITAAFGSVGTALFEIVSWMLAVWAAHNCKDILRAATAARLATVVGHLLGTLIVIIGFAAGSDAESASSACGFIIMFIYIVLLIILMRYPNLQAPFTSSAESMVAMRDSGITVEETSQMIGTKKEGVDASDNEARRKAMDDVYWKDPCDNIADTYRLTPRERDVFQLLARGRSMSFIEERLVISHNTLKMHIRHIYTKLDIHSKQEVIDMVEQVRKR